MDKNILDPYKTIGAFVHGPVALSKSMPFSFAAASYNSFKIYSDQLAIKMVSPCFDSAIICLYTFNQFTYVCTKQKLYKIKYHHVIRQWTLPKRNSQNYESASILVFQKVIFLGLEDTIYSISQEKANDPSSQQQHFETSIIIGISFKEILHPVTYINKLIAYSQDSIILFNPVSSKILFNYNASLKDLLKQNNRIAKLSVTPLIDIIAVCLDQGEIVILNIRTSKIVFVMKQKRTVTAITFSETDSFMATADSLGNIILWDLQNKKIVYRLQSAVLGSIDSLFFVPGYQLLTATSSIANCVKQFRINLDDNKTLLQYRQRSGCHSRYPIIGLKCQNNKQITFSTENMTVFSSLYSHSNMYSLPFCLDSILPYHVVSKNFTVQLYRERTQISKINIHENAHVGKISISKKFAIIGTKNRIIKIAIPSGSNPTTSLVICLEWKIQNPQQIILQNQRFIFVVSEYGIIVLNFNQPTVASVLNENDLCVNTISNRSQTMLAFENRTKKAIQIWDMRSLSICRQYMEKKGTPTTKLCFTSDNKYLLSSHEDQTISVWSMLQNTLYKTVMMENKIVQMCFTPDNSYFLSVFENSKQINIWHNYVGKITSSQIQKPVLKFSTHLNYLHEDDYRSRLAGKINTGQQISLQEGSQLNSLLDELQEENDEQIRNYQFESYSRWMPLVYYDQIKKRNSISNQEQQNLPSLPFFLDFKNLSQEQEKINNQIKQQTIKKRNQQRQKIDSQLKNDLHQINLNDSSTSQEYITTWRILSTLSVAEADYQIRRYLLLPGHSKHILKMLNHVFETKQKVNQMILNIIIVRVLDLAGSEICSTDCKEQGKKLLFEIRKILQSQQNVIQRCVAVSSQV